MAQYGNAFATSNGSTFDQVLSTGKFIWLVNRIGSSKRIIAKAATKTTASTRT